MLNTAYYSGLTKSDYKISKDLSNDELFKKNIVTELENNWHLYNTEFITFSDELDYLKWCVKKVIDSKKEQ